MAIIVDEKHASYVAGPGDTLAPGTQVAAIDAARGTLTMVRDGLPFELRMAPIHTDTSDGGAAQKAPAPTPGAPGSGGSSVSPIREPGSPGSAVPSTQAVPAAGILIKELAETVDPKSAMLQVKGKVTNTGSGPAGPMTLVVTFHRASGEETQKLVVIASPVPSGVDTPFSTETSVGTDPVVSYTIAFSGGTPASGTPSAEGSHKVPVTVYSELAKQQIKVDVQLGGPSNTAAAVQVFVSIVGTEPIPSQWVKDVRVFIPLGARGDGQEIHVAPGQTQAIHVPVPLPGPRMVAPALGGAVPAGQAPSFVGIPQILAVTLVRP